MRSLDLPRATPLAFRGAVLVPVLLGLAACTEASDGRVGVGLPAPAFSAPTLAGDTVALADLEDELLLLNIWATWCTPCREEMPDLQELEERFGGENFRVIGVSIDQAGQDAAVRRFVEDHAIDFLILRDPQGVAPRRFRTVGVPETFLIRPGGIVAARWIGQIDPAAVAEAVRGALAGD